MVTWPFPERTRKCLFWGRYMKTASITLVTLLGLGLAMPAVARDHDEHRDEHRRAEHREHEREREHRRREHEHERDHGRHHDPFARRDPAGWAARGKKKGWGECDAPPGQAKKQGCESRHEYHHASASPRAVERPVMVNRPVAVNHPIATQPPLPSPQAPTKKPVFVPHTPDQIREAQRQQRR